MRKTSRIALVALTVLALVLTAISCKGEPSQSGGGISGGIVELPGVLKLIAKAGDTYDFAAAGKDASSEWKSSNNAAATVDNAGRLTVAGTGDTTITHGADECQVTIITWDEAKDLVNAGGKLDLSAYTALDTAVPEDWLKGNTDTTEIVFPAGAKELGMSCCQDNTGLVTVTLPDSLTKLAQYAFSGCTSLTTVTGIGDAVELETDVFHGCTSLPTLHSGRRLIRASLTADSVDIPDGIQTICTAAFKDTSVNSVTIPTSVKRIEGFSFYECASLSSLTIPEGVTYIGSHAFCYDEFTEFTIPDSVRTLGQSAFSSCRQLSSVVIGANVEELKSETFKGCTALKNITLRGTSTPLALTALEGATALEHIYVPASSVNYYKAAPNWNAYSSLISAAPAP